MVTAFNPCGVAMLPAFLSLLLARDAKDLAGWTSGAKAGVAMTAGFMAVFGLAGVIVAGLGHTIFVLAPITSVLVAVGFLWLAVELWRGRSGWTGVVGGIEEVVTRRLRPRGRWAFLIYGVAYALISLTCSLPVFIAVAATGFHHSVGTGLIQYAVYALGMGVIVTGLAILTAVARDLADRAIQIALPLIPKLSAVVMAVGSLYLLWYWFGGPGTKTGLI